jgi:hypothetical protein
MGVVDSSELPVVDLSKLPKTPEEYRLTMLWMKAVEATDFDKAEVLRKLLWEEQFENGVPADRVQMFKKARVEERLEALAAMDRLEKRLRAEGSPAKLANLNKLKEIARKSHEEEDIRLDKILNQLIIEQSKHDERELSILDDKVAKMLAVGGARSPIK